MEDAYNNLKYGHANFSCASNLVFTHKQYEKAVPYLWCVFPHCSTNCPGKACPTRSVGLDDSDMCESEIYNLLGFSSRKKTVPDYDEAEEYYRKALQAWSGNCPAMDYLTELYTDTNNVTFASRTLSRLCSNCGRSDSNTKLAMQYMNKSSIGIPELVTCRTNVSGSGSTGSGRESSSSEFPDWAVGLLGVAGAGFFAGASYFVYQQVIQKRPGTPVMPQKAVRAKPTTTVTVRLDSKKGNRGKRTEKVVDGMIEEVRVDETHSKIKPSDSNWGWDGNVLWVEGGVCATFRVMVVGEDPVEMKLSTDDLEQGSVQKRPKKKKRKQDQVAGESDLGISAKDVAIQRVPVAHSYVLASA